MVSLKVFTVFDDGFLEMGTSFINSLKHFSSVPFNVSLPSSAKKTIAYCQNNNIESTVKDFPDFNPKQASRLLKMECINAKDCSSAIYMDSDIIFQGDIQSVGDLDPNYLWVLSKREGHQTTLRTWKKHYFAKSDYEFAKTALRELTDIDPDILLQSPVRNCGVIYGGSELLASLMSKAKKYYLKMLEINKTQKLFSDSDQLCFLIAFHELKDKIKELPIKFNRMPYHQSYDFKDMSSLLIPDTVVLHLNRCKNIGSDLVQSWAAGKTPIIKTEENTRSGIIIPMQTSSIAERALMKNLYFLEVCNKANVYRDEDVGFPIAQRVDELDNIRRQFPRHPAMDSGLFFMVNGHLFMIDHGEKIGDRAPWGLGKLVERDKLCGIFLEQTDEDLDTSKSKVPVIPLSYGAKQPSLWLNQAEYHQLGVQKDKKYSVHFIGNFTTNKSDRNRQAELIASIPNSKIEHRKNSKRLDFHDYMKDLASSYMVWCPPGGRPKTHREIEAMCCEVAVVMPRQRIMEQEDLIPDFHYIQIQDDYKNAVEKINYFLQNKEALAEIAKNGRLWFERNCSESARAKFILEKCLQLIEEL
jgi:hypothetical protein